MALQGLLAGRLRERVTIQQDTRTTDTQGGRSVAAATLATVWASVEPWATQMDEMQRAGAMTTTRRYRVRLRYRADVTEKMRVLWTPFLASTAKTLEISAVNVVSRDQLSLDCIEVAA